MIVNERIKFCIRRSNFLFGKLKTCKIHLTFLYVRQCTFYGIRIGDNFLEDSFLKPVG